MSTSPTCNASNCLSCLTNGSCLRCKEGYGINQGLCILCPQNCKNCDATNCLTCNNGFAFLDGSCQSGQCTEPNCALSGYKGCSKCQERYKFSNYQCFAPPCSDFSPYCQQCDLNGCLACETGFTFSALDRTCLENKSFYRTWYFYTGAFLFVAIFLKCFQGCVHECRKKPKHSDLRDADLTQSIIEEDEDEDESYILYHENYNHENQAIVEQSMDLKKVKKFHANLYTFSKFQLGLFLKIFLLNLISSCGLGFFVQFFINFFEWKFGQNIAKFSTQMIAMGLGVISTVFLFYGINNEPLWLLSPQILQFFQQLLFLSFLSASIAAYTNKQVADLLKSHDLKDIKDKNRYNWPLTQIKDFEHIKTEVNLTFLRLNIDASLFYLTFLELESPPPEYLRFYKDPDTTEAPELPEFEQNMVLNGSLPFIQYNTPVHASELLNQIPSFERYLFKLRYLSGESIYDKTKAFGYQIALQFAQRTTVETPTIVYFGFALSLMNSFLVCFYTSRIFGEDLGFFTKIGKGLGWIILVFTQRFLVLMMMSETMGIVNSKRQLLEKLYKMLSTNQLPTFFAEDRQTPIVNIFDVMSLKTWSTLRKVFMHLYEQRLASLTLALALFMIFQIALLAGIGLIYFGIIRLHGIDLTDNLTLFAIDATLSLFVICIVFSYCVKVNDQYQIHRDLVRTNKGIVIKMFQFYPSMIGDQPIKPGSHIYNYGFQILHKEFGTNFSPDQMEKRLESLVQTYDQILQDLEFEEIHHPLKLIGIPIRSTLLKSLGALIVTSLSALLKKSFAT